MQQNKLKEKILYEITTGATPQQCADKYNVPAGTIRSWVSRMKRNVAKKKPATKDATQRKNETTKKATKKPKEPIIKLEDVDEELTEKQRLFCLLYLRNFNATQAAIKAGYSVNTAAEIGYENLTKPQIRAEIQRLKEIKAQSIMLSADDIVERYMRIAFADMTDFVEFGRVSVPVMGPYGPVEVENEETGEKQMVTEEVNDVRFKDSDAVDGGLICQIKQGRQGMSIKLEDRHKALDWLAGYFELNPMDRHKMRYDEERLKIEREKINNEKTAPEQGVMIVDDVDE
jgi:phage terminase small subunit